ncbi:hypothetical protein BDZ89DRAFT_1032376 [Hymenopellis radicata]|nr:hypothetical protein BDZ89DRAFT_1032376 [Hymenopellis radicata]
MHCEGLQGNDRGFERSSGFSGHRAEAHDILNSIYHSSTCRAMATNDRDDYSPLTRQRSRSSKFSTLSQLNEDDSTPWTKTGLVDSPLGPEHNPFNDVVTRPESPRPRWRPKLEISPAVTTNGSTKVEIVPPSPSLARWDTVRQLVLPSSPPANHVQHASSSSSLNIPPKPSRITHKFGFKQVVESARQVAVDDTQKFAYELQRACWASRFGEVKAQTTINTHGSSLSINQLTNVKMRRASLPLAAGSLKQLYHVLLNHASSESRHLPLESLVLSTLLIPFLRLDKGARVDEERWFALESFEIIRKTWGPADESAWNGVCGALKAALIPPSPLRVRVLTCLWNLTVPPDTYMAVTTPLSFQALVQGLFSLLPWVDSHTEEGKMLTQIIFHVRTGSCGELDDIAVEQDYNAIFIDGDNQQAVRDVMVVEALGKCIENSSDSDRKWLLTNVVDDYWPVHSRDSSPSFSPLLASMHARKLNCITRIFCTLLQSTAPESNRRLNDSLLIIKLSRERVLPELDVLTIPAVFEAKRHMIKAILLMMTAEDAADVGRWCIATVSHWYRETGEWKSTFEKGLKHVSVDRSVTGCYGFVQVLPQEVRKQVMVVMLPVLNDVAATKEISVVNHLCIIQRSAKFLPDFWTHNAEMISVALMSDIGGSSGKDNDAEGNWGTARLGQSVLLVELTGRIQEIRHERENNSIGDAAFVEMVKFAYELEVRLGIMLQARERKKLVPPSQRLLFCVLFRELRLLTRSLKSAPWLQQVVTWFISYHDSIDEDFFLDEVDASVSALKNVYAMVQDGNTHKKQGRIGTAPIPVIRHTKLLEAIEKGYIARAMKLLVTVSLALTTDDYQQIGPIVWERYLNDAENSVLASIASQLIVVDRSRRPFKLARPPLPFIATDMGTSQYVRKDDPSDMKDNLPAEMRKRLAEIGWVNEDAPVNRHMDRVRTPFSLLPVQQLDRLDSKPDFTSSPLASPMASPQKSPIGLSELDEITLLRRNSSTGGPAHGVKRRVVFVPSVARIFPTLTSMVFDDDFAVAHVARATIIDLMRNDPSLLTRPILDLLAEESKDVSVAVSSFRAFLHVRNTLPPSMAYHIFNYLTGFLRYNAKNATTEEAMHDYAYVMPILAKLVPQVSELSLRDFRRAKVDLYFIPSGALFFSPTAANPYMFPQSLDLSNHMDDVPARLIAVSMVRISQNMLFLDMLKKNPQDVQLVRKNMVRLVLPTWDESPEARTLDIKDFIPRKSKSTGNLDMKDSKLNALSILLSRSYLPLVAQIFRAMSRHLNDRSELAVLVDGVNRILLAHGSDIGIVSQALIALMVASTRFHRLFISRGGYTLFMPVVMKVYAEAERHSGIRFAIEYAVNRFFAHHREAFVYQSLDVIAHIIALPEANAPWIAKSVFNLFSSLKNVSCSDPDAAGIHDSNKSQEREALMVITADEKPQTFLASLQNNKMANLSEKEYEYETKRLSVDNFVRLFLTVIAHDLTIIRSERFLCFLGYLTPHLYQASMSSRNVLQQGIEALGEVLRISPKAKGDGASHRPTEDIPQDSAMDEILDQQLNEKSNTPSDFVSLRLHYFSLVTQFTRAGGQLSSQASHRTIELVKTILREATSIRVNDAISSFMVDYTKTSYTQENNRSVKALVAFLKDLAPVISAYALTIDFSGVFDVIADLCTNPTYANEPSFSELVVYQICAAGLNACNLAVTEKMLFTLPCRTSLIRLLSHAVFLYGADVFVEVEKHAPTHDYLVGLVLPLALAIKTTAELDQDARRPEAWHREAHHRAWVRLLSFTLSACQKPRRSASEPSLLERSKSQDSSSTDKRNRLFTLVTALQVLKVIVVRAEKDLSACLPSVWLRIASFLRMILDDGNGDFSLGQTEYSPSPSPTPSPRASGQFDFSTSPSTGTFPGTFPSFTQQRTFFNPRVVDYCLWSFLELLCAYRTPLVVQMRLFMKEKVFTLDTQLRAQHRPSRPNSSIFSKPRRRQSGLASPENSPRLGPSRSWGDAQETSMLSLDPHRTPVSNRTGPRIIHLGPSADTFRRSLSPVSNFSASAQARSTKVKSLSLIQATYRRIRLVQSCMGYQSMLLPWPAGDVEEPPPTSWTTQRALKEVVDETRQLLEEFEESFEMEVETVLVNPDQSSGL